MGTSRISTRILLDHRESQLLEASERSKTPWTAERLLEILFQWPLLTGAVVAFLMFCAFLTALGIGLGVANFRDTGYPDSSDLLRIREVIQTGHFYPDGDRPPYMVSLYGPLTYLVLGVPYRLAQAAGVTPQMLVRLGVLAAFSLCVWLVYLIGKRLYGSRIIAWFCVLFAVSALPLAQWTTEIRGDFLGLAVALLSVYWFLRNDGRSPTLGAAICAGLAPLCKQTFLAVPLAVFSWLVFRRRFKNAASWAVTVGLTVGVGYAIVWWREPLMLKSIAALRHPVLEYPHALAIFMDALSQPVTPFAVIGALFILQNRAYDRLLLLFYCGVAWLMAILIIPQAGGAINYFWESLFASSVLAGSGLYELQRKANQTSPLVKAMILVLLLSSFVPMLRERLAYLSVCVTNVRHYQAKKARWESLASVVAGRRLLSTLPDVTILSSSPEMPDPYLNGTLELRGGWKSAPIAAQIDAGVYDLIITKHDEADKHQDDYRGVRKWSDSMWDALKRTYTPACVFKDDKYAAQHPSDEDEDVWLPRRAGEILPRLVAAGCVPIADHSETAVLR
jgi:Dolichyl-phosphate-mannose-protein mannosyltransferase